MVWLFVCTLWKIGEGNMNCFACQTRKSFCFQKSVFTPYLDAELTIMVKRFCIHVIS